MSEKTTAFVVTLDKDIDAEQSQRLMAAIRCLRNVASVEALPADIGATIARSRARHELTTELWDVLAKPGQR